MFDLEFQENGTIYKEMITVDKKNQVLVYDVPKHGNRGAATYLKDFLYVSFYKKGIFISQNISLC